MKQIRITYNPRNPLYAFEKEILYLVSYPSELHFIDGEVYEVDNVHYHNYFVCETSQLVKIEIE